MAALTTAVAIGVAGAGAAGSIIQGRKASKAQKRANQAQRKINQLRNRQAKRQFLRDFRQSQAAALTGAIGAGVGLESSRTQGTISSQRAQAQTAVGEFREFDRLGGEVSRQQNRAASANFKSQTFGAISSFASSFISFGGSGPATSSNVGT